MNGKPPFVDKKLTPCPASQWTAGLGGVLRQAKRLRHSLETALRVEFRQAHSCLWLVVTIAQNTKLGMRFCYDLPGLRDVRLVNQRRKSLEIAASGGFGRYRVKILVHEGEGLVMRRQVSQ